MSGGLPAPARAAPSAARLVGTLATAALVSGLALAGAYLATLPRIERNRAEALRAAVLRVLPGSTEAAAYTEQDGRLAPHPEPAGPPPEGAIFLGRTAGGEAVGWAIPADGPGFMDTIRVLYGYDPRGRRIIGLAVLDTRETPGLGDKIIDDPAFHANFQALAVEPSIVAVRKGRKSGPNEVDCITGATISSEAVVAMLNCSVERWLELIEAGAPGTTAAAAP